MQSSWRVKTRESQRGRESTREERGRAPCSLTNNSNTPPPQPPLWSATLNTPDRGHGCWETGVLEFSAKIFQLFGNLLGARHSLEKLRGAKKKKKRHKRMD